MLVTEGFCACRAVRDVEQTLKKADMLNQITPTDQLAKHVADLTAERAALLRNARPCGDTLPDTGCMFGAA
jgi:hypothetical protein